MRKRNKKKVARLFSVFLITCILFSHVFVHFSVVQASPNQKIEENTDEERPAETSGQQSVESKDKQLTRKPNQIHNEEDKSSTKEVEGSNEITESATKQEKNIPEIDEKKEKIEKSSIENAEGTPSIDFQKVPSILITEVMPFSKENDQFAYFEIYNNSNHAIQLDYYNISFHSTASSGEKILELPPTSLEPGETVVAWNNGGNLSIDDFNHHYGTKLTEEQVISYQAIPFSNTNKQTISIRDNQQEIVSASFSEEDIQLGKTLTYLYPQESTAMQTSKQQQKPTPGKLDKQQIPEKPVTVSASDAPIIKSKPVSEANVNSTITINAIIDDADSSLQAKLFYRYQGEASYRSVEMSRQESNNYHAEIPAEEVITGQIEYYIMATNAHHRAVDPTKDTPNVITVKKIEKEKKQVNTVVEEQKMINEDFTQYPQLLITEISPNTAGGGTDYFEYFELYNNTNQTLHLSDYHFIYHYTDSSKNIMFELPDVDIASEETLVFWYNNGKNELEAFNEQFSTNLTKEEVIPFNSSSFPGFANGGNRALIIKDHKNNEVVYADYLGEDNNNDGKVIQYKYPLEEATKMKKHQVLADPTPGMVDEVQVPSESVEVPEEEIDQEAPMITHKQVKEGQAFSPISIQAEIVDNHTIPSANLYVKKKDSEYISLPMSIDPENPSQYTVEIPGNHVDENLTYYIEATDGRNKSKTEEFTIQIDQEKIDSQALPPLLVTEVVPDTTNTGSADGYEFIEIYNNTDQPINLKDYKIQYRYGTDPESDVIWPSIPDDVVIPAKETLVFWIINGHNNDQTVADFNANFSSQLVENQDIVRIESAGMANGSTRGLIIASNTGIEYSIAYYNDTENVDDVVANKGIVYRYPVDKTNVMEKISAGELDATPGTVEDYQVPNEPVQKQQDTIAPEIDNITTISQVNHTENIDLQVSANDNQEVKTVAVYYRTEDEKEFKEALLEESEEKGVYQYRIYAPEIIGKEYVEYYFQASDGTNSVKSGIETIRVASDLDQSPLRLNVENEQILSGKSIIKGTAEKSSSDDLIMKIDEQVINDTYKAVEHQAYLAFEVSGINTYFQNGVTIGDEIVHIFDDWMAQWETITVPIDPTKLQLGDNTITIRAGNKATPWEGDPGENRDDFNLRNVRLVMTDGTVLTDPSHPDPSDVLDMGDDGTERIAEHFTFTITDGLANSLAYQWDTTTVEDGSHRVQILQNTKLIERKVFVDNTAPIISPNMEENRSYKGEFEINAEITDEIAGVDSYQAWLDNEEITLPYMTSSGSLAPGEHVLKIKAIDKVGNAKIEEIMFHTVEENPTEPNNQTDTQIGDPKLRVKVKDPMGDQLDVGFYQAFQYKPSDKSSVISYQSTAKTEPPATKKISAQAELSDQELKLASEQDGKYLVTDSTTEFPYHRFDVTLDESVNNDDQVELVWNGHSLEGRKVSMYAWNIEKAQWDLIDYQIAGTDDFTLSGYVEVSKYADNHTIHVIIQDEIPANPNQYDYTFVWMSDTQYYSESYPHIYDRQTQWIAENQEKMNIEYVFHSGDLVDEADQEYQWLHADEYMKTLDDANIPYGVLAGNHDVLQKDNDYTEYYKYFGEDRFMEKPYYGGSYLNNRGHYDLISVNGNDFIMMYLGWGIDEEGIAWMNEILAQYPDRMAILTFHEYLQATGTRHPLGEKLYNEVVIPNENVVAVLSGHYHEAQTLIDEIDDDGDGTPDRTVYQMLADYQAGPEGGQGYMRLLHFDSTNNRIFVNTYSPYMDDYNYYDTDEYPNKDEFMIDLDLTPKEKRVATDSFVVNVYTNSEIGTVQNVASGDTAEITWSGLEEGKTYYWYTRITDQYSGSTRSSIWSLIKGRDDVSEGEHDENNQDEGTGTGDNDQEQPPTKPEVNPIQDEKGNEIDNQDEIEKHSESDKIIRVNKNQDKEPLTSKQGISLPDTATNIYNLLLGSMVLLVMGIILFIWQRQKRQKQTYSN